MINKYQKIVEDTFKKEDRVCSYEIDGNKVYVKKREKQKKLRHVFQGILQKITREPMLILSVLPASENEVLFESNKIKELEKQGVSVPHILEVTENYFIMSDTGESLKNYVNDQIEKQKIKDKYEQDVFKEEYVQRALDTLIKLHNTGNAQGGCQIRNFTIKDEVISLIDFEEVIPTQHMKTFQKRDFLLFVLSLQRSGFNPNIRKLSDYYMDNTEYKTLYSELREFLLKFKWLYFLEWKIFKKIRMKDVRDFLLIIKMVE
jgi:tRNA A-37 threonylcarbamoyl transferase component Bud32